MIDQAVALDHIISELVTLTGRPVFFAEVHGRQETPYAIAYVLPSAVRPHAVLSNDPGPWRCELQVTAVGRDHRDASWMIAQVDHHLNTMDPPTGYAMNVEGTVSPVNGESVGVCTMVARWAVAI